MSWHPAGRLAKLACCGAALVASTACATRVDIRSLTFADAAIGFELRGASLAELHAQAQRLCPRGAETWRQWQRQESYQTPPGTLRRWFVEPLDPPFAQAQLQVVCRG